MQHLFSLAEVFHLKLQIALVAQIKRSWKFCHYDENNTVFHMVFKKIYFFTKFFPYFGRPLNCFGAVIKLSSWESILSILFDTLCKWNVCVYALYDKPQPCFYYMCVCVCVPYSNVNYEFSLIIQTFLFPHCSNFSSISFNWCVFSRGSVWLKVLNFS